VKVIRLASQFMGDTGMREDLMPLAYLTDS
jgi:hypothetical protein